MKRQHSSSARTRALRLVALGLAAGVLAGAAAAGDIEASLRKGRIAEPAAAPVALPVETTRVGGDFELGRTHGFALAAELRITRREECRTVAIELRAGCLDYVATRGAAGSGPLDLPL